MNCHKSKVLVIETNKALGSLWTTFLMKRGYDAHAFIEGLDDPKALGHRGLPDIIVSGVESKGQISSGEDICLNLYGEGAKSHYAPVILVSNQSSQALPQFGLKKPAFMVLEKPLKLSAFATAVRKAWFVALQADSQKTKSAVMTADLSDGGIKGVLQFIDGGGKTGLLLAENNVGDGGALAFAAGVPQAAFCGDLVGVEAAMEMLSWSFGRATFFSGSMPECPMNLDMANSIDLTTRAEAEIKIMQKVESEVAIPGAIIRLGETPAPPGGAVEAVILAKAKARATLDEVVSAAVGHTRRQILLALARLLDADAVEAEMPGNSIAGFDLDFKAEMKKAFSVDSGGVEVYHPHRVGVYSPSPSMASRFLGLFCDEELATAIAVKYMNVMILFSDVGRIPEQSEAFFDYAAVIAIWDPKHPESADSFHKFLALASAAKIHNLLAIHPKGARWKDKPGMEPHLLFKKDDGTLFGEMEFTMDKDSCLKVAERLLCL